MTKHARPSRSATAPAPASRGTRRRGFTLVELIAASVIAAILSGVATMSIRQLALSRDRSSARQAAVESVHSITRLIARDFANIARDVTLLDTIVRIDDTPGSGEQQTDEILLFCRSMRPVRVEQQEESTYREAGIHEVHYRLKPDREVVGVLWRRSDPIVDENYEGGGVAVPLGTQVFSLDFEAFDGMSWLSTWNSDNDGLPHALRVTCRVVEPLSGAMISARATVALDRVPLPFDPEVDETYDPSMDVENLEFGTEGETGGGDLFQFEGGSTTGGGRRSGPQGGGGGDSGGGRDGSGRTQPGTGGGRDGGGRTQPGTGGGLRPRGGGP